MKVDVDTLEEVELELVGGAGELDGALGLLGALVAQVGAGSEYGNQGRPSSWFSWPGVPKGDSGGGGELDDRLAPAGLVGRSACIEGASGLGGWREACVLADMRLGEPSRCLLGSLLVPYRIRVHSLRLARPSGVI